MGYCVVSDVKTIKAVTPLLSPNGQWTDDDILSLIDEVGEQEIDVRLAGRYAVPFSPVPDAVKRVTKLKTAYAMIQREYGESGGKWDNLKEEAEYLLSRLEQGVIEISGAELSGGFTGGRAVTADSNRYFSME